jgi:hypothetical protein
MFAVQVVRVECPDSGEVLKVFPIHEVPIRTFPVPSIEAVIPNHSESFAWQGALILENVVQILDSFISTGYGRR